MAAEPKTHMQIPDLAQALRRALQRLEARKPHWERHHVELTVVRDANTHNTVREEINVSIPTRGSNQRIPRDTVFTVDVNGTLILARGDSEVFQRLRNGRRIQDMRTAVCVMCGVILGGVRGR